MTVPVPTCDLAPGLRLLFSFVLAEFAALALGLADVAVEAGSPVDNGVETRGVQHAPANVDRSAPRRAIPVAYDYDAPSGLVPGPIYAYDGLVNLMRAHTPAFGPILAAKAGPGARPTFVASENGAVLPTSRARLEGGFQSAGSRRGRPAVQRVRNTRSRTGA